MAKGRPARSRPTEGEASSNHEASSPHEQTTVSSSRPVSCHTAASAQPQNEVVTLPLPALLTIQGAIERLAGNQAT